MKYELEDEDKLGCMGSHPEFPNKIGGFVVQRLSLGICESTYYNMWIRADKLTSDGYAGGR